MGEVGVAVFWVDGHWRQEENLKIGNEILQLTSKI